MASAATDFLAHLQVLDAALRDNHFKPDPASWLRIHDLLAHLARVGGLPATPAGYRALLAPLICSTKEQQADFYRIFDQWAAAPTARPTASSQIGGNREVIASRRVLDHTARHWPTLLAAVIGLLAIIAWGISGSGVLQWVEDWMQSPSTKVIAPTTLKPSRLPPTPPTTAPVPPPPPTPAIDVKPVPPRAAARSAHVPRFISDSIGQALPLMPGLLALVWLARRLYRRYEILKRQRAGTDDPVANLKLHGGTRRPFWGGAVPRVLHRLRRGAPLEIRTLDIHRTVDSTIRRAGLFYPVRARRHWRPEYLMLIDRAEGNNHAAGLALALYERLAADGLNIHRYHYDGNLASCVDKGERRRYSLRDLGNRHANARLLVMGDGRDLFHPLTAEPLPVLSALSAWAERVWFTSRPAPWGHHEYHLATTGFAVAPLSGAGVEAACRWFEQPTSDGAPWFEPAPAGYPAFLRLDPTAWLAASLPAGASLATLTAALQAYLGPKGVLLLTAIATYPQVHPDLTTALDELLFPRDSASVSEQRLLRLSRLPWCRFGKVPDYLRLHWLTALQDHERVRIAKAFEWIFDSVGGGSRNALSLPFGNVRRGVGAYLRDLIRFARPNTPLDDAIFANIMLGGRLGPLDFKLPRALAALLPHKRWQLGPIVLALMIAVSGAWSVDYAWRAYGQAALEARSPTALAWFNQHVHVEISATPAGEPLARALADSLAVAGFTGTGDKGKGALAVGKIATPAPATNTIEFGSWWARFGVAQIAEQLAWLTYHEAGRKRDWSTRQTASVGIHVVVVAPPSGGPEAVFRDPLVHAWVPPTRSATVKDNPAVTPLLPLLIEIPSGTFKMGSPEGEVGRDNDEGPPHDVKISPFALSKTEVTFAEYDRFTAATGRPPPDDSGWGRGTRPVINVSWKDATAYAEWLSTRTGEAYRLPTEAEWEYAARGDSTTAYWWGNDIRRGKEVMANCDGCGSEWDNKQTAPAGSFAPNKFGLHDMHGNAWEWTADCWHANYAGAPTDGRAWEAAGDCSRVIRGGSWFHGPAGVRSATRAGLIPGGAFLTLGFRVARTLQ